MTATNAQRHLPSWNDGPAKDAILNFVTRVTKEGGPDFIPAAERIATFDNDGTLWAERPLIFQLYFTTDRLEQLAARKPEMREQQPFKAFLEKDMKTLAALGKEGILEVAFATHAGITSEEFGEEAHAWFNSARHPQLDRLFTECVYQPQLELLDYLRANGFKTFIVTGGGIEFVRAFAERTYGVPPEQVVGSSDKYRLETRGGKPVLFKLTELNSFDDRDEKVVNIHLHVGRRPVLAFGNSDGDLRMLQYAGAGRGARMKLLLHHDDGAREFAYDKDFRLSPLDEALRVAPEEGITVVSMKNDWKQIFPAALRDPAPPAIRHNKS